MKKCVLITRPLYDTPTQYLHFISGELKNEIDAVREITVIDLQEKRAVRKEFENVLDKMNPRLVILHGHGSYDSVFGQDSEVILDKNNMSKLQSKIVYAVACDSAHELGEAVVDCSKAESYVGYESNFMIIIDPATSTTPAKDKNLKPFKELHKTFILAFLSGFNVSQSVDKTKNHIRQLIREYGIRGIKDKYGDAPLIRFALYWDLTCLKAYGNMEALF